MAFTRDMKTIDVHSSWAKVDAMDLTSHVTREALV